MRSCAAHWNKRLDNWSAHIPDMKKLVVFVLLAAFFGCASSHLQIRGANGSAGKNYRVEGTMTLHNAALGTQSGDFILLYSPIYGSRLEVFGPTGGPILFASVSGNSFEVYSVADDRLIRDDRDHVLQNASSNMIALVATTLAGLGSWLSGFGPSSAFAAQPVTGGWEWHNDDMHLLWQEEFGLLKNLLVEGQEHTLFLSAAEADRFFVHFGDNVPLLSLKIRYFESDVDLKGARWQLKVPPSAQVSSFARFLAP